MEPRRYRPATMGATPIDETEARLFFLASMLADAVEVVTGQRPADTKETLSCKRFLQSEKAARWAAFVGVDHACILDAMKRCC